LQGGRIGSTVPKQQPNVPAIIEMHALLLNELPLAAIANQPELVFHLFVKRCY